MKLARLVVVAALALGMAGLAHAGEKLEVTAKLVDIAKKFPPDDLYDYAFVMKYQVTGGDMDGKTLYVAHYKPRVPRSKIKDKMKKYVSGNLKKFKVGDVHRLALDPDLKKIWSGAIHDEYFATDRTSPRYWCLEANKK